MSILQKLRWDSLQCSSPSGECMSSALKVMGKLGTVGLAHPICSVSLRWSHRKLGSVAFACVCVCVYVKEEGNYTQHGMKLELT